LIQKEIIIENPLGLHAYPATLFAKKAMEFSSEVRLSKDEREVDGKSVLLILTLAVEKGDKVTLKVSGEDEGKAFEALKSLLLKSEE